MGLLDDRSRAVRRFPSRREAVVLRGVGPKAAAGTRSVRPTPSPNATEAGRLQPDDGVGGNVEVPGGESRPDLLRAVTRWSVSKLARRRA